MQNLKSVWLVIEQGSGIIHRAFQTEDEANKFADVLKVCEDMDCFEVQEVEVNKLIKSHIAE